MIILINSSKTMVSRPAPHDYQQPELLDEAVRLDKVLKRMKVSDLGRLMHLSPSLATRTHELIQRWNVEATSQTQALDAFQGDIYRGLIAKTLPEPDRAYANEHLRILSGLYGILKPFDRIMPYRLELMYPLKGRGFANLYQFWSGKVAETLPKSGLIVDLASDEYARLVRPFVDPDRIVEPTFLSKMTPASQPTFVAVHAKVARGAYARWLITTRTEDPASFGAFCELGYVFDATMSTPGLPTFIKTV